MTVYLFFQELCIMKSRASFNSTNSIIFWRVMSDGIYGSLWVSSTCWWGLWVRNICCWIWCSIRSTKWILMIDCFWYKGVASGQWGLKQIGSGQTGTFWYCVFLCMFPGIVWCSWWTGEWIFSIVNSGWRDFTSVTFVCDDNVLVRWNTLSFMKTLLAFFFQESFSFSWRWVFFLNIKSINYYLF